MDKSPSYVLIVGLSSKMEYQSDSFCPISQTWMDKWILCLGSPEYYHSYLLLSTEKLHLEYVYLRGIQQAQQIFRNLLDSIIKKRKSYQSKLPIACLAIIGSFLNPFEQNTCAILQVCKLWNCAFTQAHTRKMMQWFMDNITISLHRQECIPGPGKPSTRFPFKYHVRYKKVGLEQNLSIILVTHSDKKDYQKNWQLAELGCRDNFHSTERLKVRSDCLGNIYELTQSTQRMVLWKWSPEMGMKMKKYNVDRCPSFPYSWCVSTSNSLRSYICLWGETLSREQWYVYIYEIVESSVIQRNKWFADIFKSHPCNICNAKEEKEKLNCECCREVLCTHTLTEPWLLFRRGTDFQIRNFAGIVISKFSLSLPPNEFRDASVGFLHRSNESQPPFIAIRYSQNLVLVDTKGRYVCRFPSTINRLSSFFFANSYLYQIDTDQMMIYRLVEQKYSSIPLFNNIGIFKNEENVNLELANEYSSHDSLDIFDLSVFDSNSIFLSESDFN